MVLKLYDLAAADPDRRFSPFCWRTKMALAHKELEVETIPGVSPTRTQSTSPGKGAFPYSSMATGSYLNSWAIATYL